jgi:hypothetical protein
MQIIVNMSAEVHGRTGKEYPVHRNTIRHEHFEARGVHRFIPKAFPSLSVNVEIKEKSYEIFRMPSKTKENCFHSIKLEEKHS